MKKSILCIFICVAGFASTTMGQSLAPAIKPVPPDPTRLVDGVDLASFQSIQSILLEVAADDVEIAAVDKEMEQLREQRAALCYKAAARLHPELADKLKIMEGKQVERLKQEQAVASEAKLAAKKKG